MLEVNTNRWAEEVKREKININTQKWIADLEDIDKETSTLAFARKTHLGTLIKIVKTWNSNPSYKDLSNFRDAFIAWRQDKIDNKKIVAENGNKAYELTEKFIKHIITLMSTSVERKLDAFAENAGTISHVQKPNLDAANSQLDALFGNQAQDAKAAFRDLVIANQQINVLSWCARQIVGFRMGVASKEDSQNIAQVRQTVTHRSLTGLENQAIAKLAAFAASLEIKLSAEQKGDAGKEEAVINFQQSLRELVVGSEDELSELNACLGRIQGDLESKAPKVQELQRTEVDTQDWIKHLQDLAKISSNPLSPYLLLGYSKLNKIIDIIRAWENRPTHKNQPTLTELSALHQELNEWFKKKIEDSDIAPGSDAEKKYKAFITTKLDPAINKLHRVAGLPAERKRAIDAFFKLTKAINEKAKPAAHDEKEDGGEKLSFDDRFTLANKALEALFVKNRESANSAQKALRTLVIASDQKTKLEAAKEKIENLFSSEEEKGSLNEDQQAAYDQSLASLTAQKEGAVAILNQLVSALLVETKAQKNLSLATIHQKEATKELRKYLNQNAAAFSENLQPIIGKLLEIHTVISAKKTRVDSKLDDMIKDLEPKYKAEMIKALSNFAYSTLGTVQQDDAPVGMMHQVNAAEDENLKAAQSLRSFFEGLGDEEISSTPIAPAARLSGFIDFYVELLKEKLSKHSTPKTQQILSVVEELQKSVANLLNPIEEGEAANMAQPREADKQDGRRIAELLMSGDLGPLSSRPAGQPYANAGFQKARPPEGPTPANAVGGRPLPPPPPRQATAANAGPLAERDRFFATRGDELKATLGDEPKAALAKRAERLGQEKPKAATQTAASAVKDEAKANSFAELKKQMELLLKPQFDKHAKAAAQPRGGPNQ